VADPRDVIEGRARWCVVQGDALGVLAAMPDGCVDAIVTDPPYSSGGLFLASRSRNTGDKYTNGIDGPTRPNFAGDNRDQRSFVYWCSLWMEQSLRCSREQGRIACFTDWRQLPAMTDAIQCGGWLYRGIIPWDKTESARPVPGVPRAQCEYVVWGVNGPIDTATPGTQVLAGFLRHRIDAADKHHQTGKPVPLMRDLVKLARLDGVVLDPFAGSGSTGVAALIEGRRVILCEKVPEYARIARERCAAAEEQRDWKEPRQLGLLAPVDGEAADAR